MDRVRFLAGAEIFLIVAGSEVPALPFQWTDEVSVFQVKVSVLEGIHSPPSSVALRRGDEIFRTRPDRPWGPPSLLYNGYRFFPRGKAAEAWP